ncbi:MAG: hypothetical protein HY052_06225 [Proteobacteria bacterium]|nr:hypothetical protein [Pseudomonadota bacterium]
MKSIDLGQKCRPRQAGNVLFFILIAIALFAALTFSFSRSSRMAGKMSFEDSQIYAQQIISYADKVNNALQRVMLGNGCLESQINFDNSTVAGYANAASPANKKCNIFDSAGGVIAYEAPPSAALDTTAAAAAPVETGNDLLGQYFFTGKVCVDKVGTGPLATCASDGLDNEELLLILPWVNYDVCVTINKILGNSADMLQASGTSFDNTKFTGTFADGFALGNAAYTTYQTGCYQSVSANSPGAGYHFYHTLLAR